MFSRNYFAMCIALSTTVTITGATAAGQQDKGPAFTKLRVGDLQLKIRPTEKVFPPMKSMTFEVIFKNVSKKVVPLAVTEYLGDQRTGRYDITIREKGTKKVWKIGRDPNAILPGAPARLSIKKLSPGDAISTKFRVPHIGQRFWRGGTEKAPKRVAAHLPAGQFELIVGFHLKEGKAKTEPIPFTVGAGK